MVEILYQLIDTVSYILDRVGRRISIIDSTALSPIAPPVIRCAPTGKGNCEPMAIKMNDVSTNSKMLKHAGI